jgi:hypothetical protein
MTETVGLVAVAGCYERVLFGYEFDLELDTKFTQKFVTAAHDGCIKALAVSEATLVTGSTDQLIK